MPEAGAILYVASQLPKRSETFVYREILALRAAGETVAVASVHPPERELGDPALDELAAGAVGIYGPGAARLLCDAALEKLAHPVRAIGTFLRALGDAATADDVRAPGRLKALMQAVAALALARRLRRGPVRIRHIHAHMAHVPATIAMYAARQLGVPFSFTGHAADLFRDRALLRVKLRRAAFVACISRWHRQFYQSLVPRDDAAYPVIRCAVDIAPLPPAPPPGDAGPPLILGTGRLVPKKGFDILLEALALVRGCGRVFRAIIAGDGPQAAALREQCARLGLADCVELPGAVSNRRALALLRSATIFALPCRVDAQGDRDGIPVVLMEAMAAGVPCISGDLPTIRELIADGVSGRLVEPNQIEPLAGALLQLLDNPARREALAAGARRRIDEEFSMPINIARLRRAFTPEPSP